MMVVFSGVHTISTIYRSTHKYSATLIYAQFMVITENQHNTEPTVYDNNRGKKSDATF
uniref:Uncharacterized protein n=1 Tax=Arundo donax TaxID=35708 RepID=A0A0A9HTE4_ARUDO